MPAPPNSSADHAFEVLSTALPRILVVSRRSVRKNKFIDFVGEYHLDLLVKYGACPVIVPRVENVSTMIDAYSPIHGVLLCEGEDISSAFRPSAPPLETSLLSSINAAHPGDVVTDIEKDSIEFALVRKCLAHGIPLFGICRGSQIINVVAGGSLYPDIDACVENPCKHIDYANYDDHRHPVDVEPNTPLSNWFDHARRLSVNSYHHQGIDKLATKFEPMAHSPDGLVEGFFDPTHFDPDDGRFVIGLQFHPERMQNTSKAMEGEKHIYDYPGCPRPYEDFVRAAAAYRAKTTKDHDLNKRMKGVPSDSFSSKSSSTSKRKLKKSGSVRFAQSSSDDVRKEHEGVIKAFDLASRLYHMDKSKRDLRPHDGILSKGAAFLEATTPLARYSKDDLDRLIRSGATVHGTRLVHQLLQEKNTNSVIDDADSVRARKDETASAWKKFSKSILQAERGLESLRGTPRMSEALALVEKLSKMSATFSR